MNENIATKVRHFGTNPSNPDEVNPTYKKSMTYPTWFPENLKIRDSDSLYRTDYDSLSYAIAYYLGSSSFSGLTPSLASNTSVGVDSVNIQMTIVSMSNNSKSAGSTYIMNYFTDKNRGYSYELLPCITIKPQAKIIAR